ncbi:MAG: hypothetical protein ACT4PV_15110 [Planctomycetaceae bacterium]
MEFTGKESIVSRLFGFGRRKKQMAQEASAEAGTETGFARTRTEPHTPEEEIEDPRITVPEQVIRIKTSRLKGRDETIGAIGDSFRELSSLLGNIGDRLEKQETRAGDLTDQLKDLPEYLRSLPAVQQEQSRVLGTIAERVAEGNALAARANEALGLIPQAQEKQTRALYSLEERMVEGTTAVRGVAEVLTRIPEEFRDRAEKTEEAIREVAAAQHKTAKVLHFGHQKSLQLFHQATQKTMSTVQETVKAQQAQMQEILDASIANMRRMFLLAGGFVGAAIVGLVALLLLR